MLRRWHQAEAWILWKLWRLCDRFQRTILMAYLRAYLRASRRAENRPIAASRRS